MREKIIPYLEDLERRIQSDAEEALLKQWRDFSDGKMESGPFNPAHRLPQPSSIDWPEIAINDALRDRDLMIIRELKRCHDLLNEGSNLLMSVRANYGVGFIPSMLGCSVFIMPKETNTAPNVHPLKDGAVAISRLVEENAPGFDKGWGPAVFEAAEIFGEIREKYPLFASYVRVDHPDCQGPLDICELLWGSDIFCAFIDETELVHKLLRFVTDFYISCLDHWYALLPPVDSYHEYFNRLHKGAVTVRGDSYMNISAEMYSEFGRPYDQEILSRYSGGMLHFCGKGDHFIEQLSAMKGLYAIDLSQPHLNNMELVTRHTLDKGINLHTGKYDGAGVGERHWGRLVQY